jgi:hypothetical protein
VAKDAIPRGARLGQDEEARRGRGSPTDALSRNLAREANLFVVTPESLLDRRQLGLDLDHEERARGAVKAEHVDGPAFAIDSVGDLDPRFPAVPPKKADHRADHPGVTIIKGSVECAAAPADFDLTSSIERAQDRSES